MAFARYVEIRGGSWPLSLCLLMTGDAKNGHLAGRFGGFRLINSKRPHYVLLVMKL